MLLNYSRLTADTHLMASFQDNRDKP